MVLQIAWYVFLGHCSLAAWCKLGAHHVEKKGEGRAPLGVPARGVAAGGAQAASKWWQASAVGCGRTWRASLETT